MVWCEVIWRREPSKSSDGAFENYVANYASDDVCNLNLYLGG